MPPTARLAALSDKPALEAIYAANVPLLTAAYGAVGENVESDPARATSSLARLDHRFYIAFDGATPAGYLETRPELVPLMTDDPAQGLYAVQGRDGTHLVGLYPAPGLTPPKLAAALDAVLAVYFADHAGLLVFGTSPRTVATRILNYLDSRYNRYDFEKLPGKVWTLWWYEVP